MFGQAVVKYLEERMRERLHGQGLTDAHLERPMGARSPRVSHWRHQNARPSYEDAKRLGEELAKQHPELGIGPYDLLQQAAYDPVPDPKAIEFEEYVHEWDELTIRFHRASWYQRYLIVREIKKILDEKP
ncbi:hypothetical protein [Actinomadura sp. 9N407]|uniref:hypothetical protein n=1 Tax=Actinomadura sp. 9N407 TaxID=3375154 RepID=UPI0037B1FEE6